MILLLVGQQPLSDALTDRNLMLFERDPRTEHGSSAADRPARDEPTGERKQRDLDEHVADHAALEIEDLCRAAEWGSQQGLGRQQLLSRRNK